MQMAFKASKSPNTSQPPTWSEDCLSNEARLGHARLNCSFSRPTKTTCFKINKKSLFFKMCDYFGECMFPDFACFVLFRDPCWRQDKDDLPVYNRTALKFNSFYFLLKTLKC